MMPVWCEIRLDYLIDNYKKIKKCVGEEVDLMPIIKADAYGHGAVQCAKVLVENGTKRFAVARIDEGIQLRRAGIKCPILILGYISNDEIKKLLEWDLTPTVYHIDFARELSRQATKSIKVHIKIDTGMGRLGFRGIEESVQSIEKIYTMDNLIVEGIYSHFATSDEEDKSYSLSQMKSFEEVLKLLKKRGINIPIKHLSNSAAIMDLPMSYYNIVRPGIILYGMYPSQEVNHKIISLKPVKSFKTRIANLKKIHSGDSVSYGRKYIAEEDRLIATLPVGYADGYSRLLSNLGEVLIRGQKAKIVGRICMDQCMVDVSHIPQVQVNDEVLLYGSELAIEEVAEKMGTINYEVSCMISPRVPKLYYWKKDFINMDKSLYT